MRIDRRFLIGVALAACALVSPAPRAQAQASPLSKVAGVVVASKYGAWRVQVTSGTGAGAGSITVNQGYVTLLDGKTISPFAINVPLSVGQGSDVETVTPSTVSACGPNSCTIGATFSNAHAAGEGVSSGDHGVQEAINDAHETTLVVVDGGSGASTSNITAATGSTSVAVESLVGGGGPVFYVWNGSAYVAALQPLMSPNGASMLPFYNEVNLTLSTTGTTTTTASGFLPAKSLILAVSGRVTTAITGSCTGWELGDTTTAARFAANDTTLTAGATNVGVVQATSGIASATTGIYQASAAAVQVTCAGGDPTAGAIRISVFGYTLAPAAQ